MTQPLEEYAAFLRAAHVDFQISEPILREVDFDGTLLVPGESPRRHDHLGFPAIVEHDLPSAALGSDHATDSVAIQIKSMLAELDGKRVLDVGCGTGLLAIQCARAGAKVVATDVDPKAIRLAERNAKENGVTLDVRLGSLLNPIAEGELFDLIVANLPHKPDPRESTSLPLGQYGGPEGMTLWQDVMPFLVRSQPPKGQLVFFMHSLPDPQLLQTMSQGYSLKLVSWKLRWLQDAEYGELRQVFRQRHQDGTSYLWHENHREALVAGTWLATRK